MKKQLQIILLFLVLLQFSCQKQEDFCFDGKTLIGYEPMKSGIYKDKPQYRWYYKTKLTFKKDSVYIEKSPISIYKSDTLYSASDGGFYQYKGIWGDKDKFEINVVETGCDYCPEALEKRGDGNYRKVVRTKNYKGNKTSNGLNLNGIEFK